jgi:hypothetical protein
VKQCLFALAARGTATSVGGVVGLYSKLTPVCIFIRHTCSRGQLVRRVWLSSASPVGDSDTHKAKPGQGTLVGAMVGTQSPIVF